jgi:hypothetical protein
VTSREHNRCSELDRSPSEIRDEQADAFYQQARTAKEEKPVEEGAIPFREWAQRIPTAKGYQLDFERFPFQPAIYDVSRCRSG